MGVDETLLRRVPKFAAAIWICGSLDDDAVRNTSHLPTSRSTLCNAFSGSFSRSGSVHSVANGAAQRVEEGEVQDLTNSYRVTRAPASGRPEGRTQVYRGTVFGWN